MPTKLFEPGNKLAKGGKREGAGRPTNEQKEELLTLAQAIEREGQRRAARLAHRYYEMAEQDPATMRHVVDGTRVRNGAEPTAIIHQFIQFTSNQNTLQLPAETVSAPVLVSDERGQDKGSEVLASEIGERHDGLEFHSFTNVSRKRGP